MFTWLIAFACHQRAQNNGVVFRCSSKAVKQSQLQPRWLCTLSIISCIACRMGLTAELVFISGGDRQSCRGTNKKGKGQSQGQTQGPGLQIINLWQPFRQTRFTSGRGQVTSHDSLRTCVFLLLRRCWAKQAQCATTHTVLIAESTDRFQTSMSNLVRACFTHRRMRP